MTFESNFFFSFFAGYSGSFLSDGQLSQQADHASDEGNAERLWELSEALVGQDFNFSTFNK